MKQAVGVSSQRSRFFVWMGSLGLLIAIAGFLPTYWLPVVSGRAFPPILHIHGAIFVGWNALYLWQSWLVATGRTADHRQWGMVGIAVATAMVISVLLAVLWGFSASAQLGMEAQARVFSSVSLSGIAWFAILFILAVRNVRNPDTHRRLMYATSVPLLQAAVARWFQVAMTPPGVIGPPPVFVAIPPGLLVWTVFFGALALHDRRNLGRLHSATIVGAVGTLAIILLPLVVGPSAAWAGVTSAFAGLAPRP